jgi:alpha-tubulin suppressor-like RCC1 family protein
MELLPKPVEALRGVRVGNVAAAGCRSYAVADTGEVWAWRIDSVLLGHGGKQKDCPKPIEWLRGVNVDAVAASSNHTLALADDGSVYTWGMTDCSGSFSSGPTMGETRWRLRWPQRIPGLRVACEPQ